MDALTPVQDMVTYAFRGSFFQNFQNLKFSKKLVFFSENFENFQYFQKHIITLF